MATIIFNEYIQQNVEFITHPKEMVICRLKKLHITEPKNLEEQALSLAGTDVYENIRKDRKKQ